MRKVSLLGIEEVKTKADTINKLKKVSKPINTKRKTNNIIDELNAIKDRVEKYLGKYRDTIDIITDENTLKTYIDKCVDDGVCVIDTETTGLDTIMDEIVGVCLYSPTNHPAYLPINHKNYITDILSKNQLTDKKTIKEQLDRLKETNVIFHNAKFDIKVLKNQLNVDIKPHWCTMIAAKCINETQKVGLKKLYTDLKGEQEEEYSYSFLFGQIPFWYVDIEEAAIYGARDAIMPYEIYLDQMKYLEKEENKGLFNIIKNIEIPLIEIVAFMENTGVNLDIEFAKELYVKYDEKKQEAEKVALDIINKYQDKIDQYNIKTKKEKDLLEGEINLNSPKQLSILLYDIMDIVPDIKGNKSGTGVSILEKIEHPIAAAILEYRKYEKLLSTYIDKIPKTNLNKKTNRVHGEYNQYGADTGRFSSKNPNMQNIPSRNKDIRKMFIPSKGYKFIRGDFSQQEPKILTQVSNDENLRKAYEEGKDIYAWAASMVFKKPYELCLEFPPEGTEFYVEGKKYVGDGTITYPEGKKLRKKTKAIILGIMYGKGINAIAEDLSIDYNEAKNLFDSFFEAFPKVKPYMEECLNFAKKNGYIETLWGRRRHLPDIQLEAFEVEDTKGSRSNPFLDVDISVDNSRSDFYLDKLNNCKNFNDKEYIKKQAEREGIKVKDNGFFIAQATRQCVNSQIQGSAADLTKLAMLNIYNDEKLRELGFKLLMTIHDEVIGECPENNVEECSKIMEEKMIYAGIDKVSIPMAVDIDILDRWIP